MILPAYAAKVFADLPGESRREKADALNKLIALLRAERDAYEPPVKAVPHKRSPTLTSVRASVIGKTLSQLKNRQVYVDGLLIAIASLVHALEAPGHVLHERAKEVFADANLKVSIEKTGARHRRRIVAVPPKADPYKLAPLPSVIDVGGAADNAIVARILRMAGQGVKGGEK